MRALTRAFDTILTLIVILALLAMGSTVLARFTPIHRGYVPTVTLTGSMLPTIQINALSIVRYCDISEVEEGDIIVYYSQSKGANIIHRAIRVEGEGEDRVVTTKGDNNPAPDPDPITGENFLGIAVLTLNSAAPLVGKLLNARGTGLDPVKLLVLFGGLMLLVWFAAAALRRLLSRPESQMPPPERGENDEEDSDEKWP